MKGIFILLQLDLRNILANKLTSITGYSTQLIVTEILERNNSDAAKPASRITIAGTPVINLTDLISKIPTAVSSTTFGYDYINASQEASPPFILILENALVTLNKIYPEDNQLTFRFGEGVFKLAFVMGYLADGDLTLPLKVIGIKLIK